MKTYNISCCFPLPVPRNGPEYSLSLSWLPFVRSLTVFVSNPSYPGIPDFDLVQICFLTEEFCFEELCLLGYNVVKSVEIQRTLRRNMSPSSVSKNKANKESA
jgi:hypothetical protein